MRHSLVWLAMLALAAPASAATLYTTGISRTGNYLECKVLNVKKKPLTVSVEIRAVTSPPPVFVSCKTVELEVVPGRIETVEQYALDCGAAGPYYAVFRFKGSAKSVRAYCYALEDQSIRSEAR